MNEKERVYQICLPLVSLAGSVNSCVLGQQTRPSMAPLLSTNQHTNVINVSRGYSRLHVL